MLNVATVFSGIGAVEQALKQLRVKYKIKFACDNGERYLKLTYDEICELTSGLSKQEKEKKIIEIYNETKKENLVKKSYLANYSNELESWYEDIRFRMALNIMERSTCSLGAALVKVSQLMEKKWGWKMFAEHYSMITHD